MRETVGQWIDNTVTWMRRDYHEWPLRFVLEILAWVGSIGCALGMTLTLPNPPLLPLYAIWVCSTVVYTWAAWTRGSFGMLANYFLLFCIDTVGLIKLIIEAFK